MPRGGITQVVAQDSFTYDAVGNRTDNAVVQWGNRLTQFDGFTVEYDSDGNVTRKSKPGLEQRLYWNALSQLDSVWDSRWGTFRYGYDAWGRRVRRTDPNFQTIRYVYDREDLFVEDFPGGSRAEYTYYPGVDNPHSVLKDGVPYYYTTHVPGHVAGLIDPQAQLVNGYRYQPFGQSEAGFPAEQVVQPLRFQAREIDGLTELYYFRNRWYDPALARFLSPDPLGLGGGINPYVFAGNDPVNRTDPFGLDGEDCPDCVGEVALKPLVANGKRSPEKDPCARGACYPRGGGGGSGMRPDGGRGGGRPAAPVPQPDPTPDWGACGLSAAGLAISAVGDAAFFSGVGVAATGARAYFLGRAGVGAVRSGAVGVGRGALLRRSNVAMAGGRGMIAAGVADAGYGWAGGLQDNFVRLIGQGDDRLYTLIPGVSTGIALWDTAQDCGSAIGASF